MSAIVVLGSANLDLVVRQPRLPRPGETMFGSDFTTVPGGKGLNQAVAAARTGARVRLLAAIGSDRPGEAVAERLVAEGIDAAGLVRLDCPTDRSMIQVDAAGENTIVSVTGCADRFAPPQGTDLDTALKAGDLLCGVLAGLLDLGAAIETALPAAIHAAAIGVTRPGVLSSFPTRAEIAAILPASLARGGAER